MGGYRAAILSFLAGVITIVFAITNPPVDGGQVATLQDHREAVRVAECADRIAADLDFARDGFDPTEVQIPGTPLEAFLQPCKTPGVPVYEDGVYGYIVVWEDGSYLIQGYGDWWTGAPYGTPSYDDGPEWDWGSGEYLPL